MEEEKNEVNTEEKALEVLETVPVQCCSCEKKTHPAGALILGVLSVCFGVSLFSLQVPGIILAIIGIVLGVKAKNGKDNTAMGKAGMVLSIIGLIFNVFNIVILGALAAVLYYSIDLIDMLPQLGCHMNTMHFMF